MSTERVPWRYRLVRERYVADNRVSLLRDANEAYPAMLAAIRNAREEVLLEMYWFGSDRTGQTFATALAEAAARGVQVAVIYDSVGSWDSDPAMFADMADAGVRVLEFGPIKPWSRRFRMAQLTRRDHRKILTVDGELGFTGGINIADHWGQPADGARGWRDDMVCVEGPAALGFVQLFQATWASQGGEALASVADALHRQRRGVQRVRVLGESARRHRRQIVRAYMANVYRAKRRVWIANSYFVPDLAVIRALRRAAARGVDVRILVPGRSDVEVVRHASRAVWSRLIEHGVRIFEWHESVLHAKSAVIDGSWSTIGTFNLDYQSLRHNLEVNVTVRDEGFGAVMESSFELDFARAREVSATELAKRALQDRALESILYRFRKIL